MSSCFRDNTSVNECLFSSVNQQYQACIDNSPCAWLPIFRIAEAKEDRGEIVVRNPRADAREPPKSFFFDAVFGDRSAQERVYEVCGAPLVESVLQGYNGTIFAYGQVQFLDIVLLVTCGT